jgi:hypothetical protein
MPALTLAQTPSTVTRPPYRLNQLTTQTTKTFPCNPTGSTAALKACLFANYFNFSADTLQISSFSGDSGSGGASGIVPAPGIGDGSAYKVLGAGGSWVTMSRPAVPLTDSATITPDLSLGDIFSVTYAGNRTWASPSGVTPGKSYLFKAAQDATGNRQPRFGVAWQFPGGAPVFSTTAYAIDAWACAAESAGPPPVMRCGGVLGDVKPIPPVLLASATQGAAGSFCGTGSVTSCTSQSLAVVAGSTLVVGNANCQNGTCSGAGGMINVSSVTGSAGVGTCGQISGSRKNYLAFGVDVWTCPVNVSGTITVTANFVAPAFYPRIVVADVSYLASSSIDDGITATASSTGTSVSATASATTQASDFVFSMYFTASGAGQTKTPNLTAIANDGIIVAQYGIFPAGIAPVASVANPTSIDNAITVVGLRHL